MDLKAARTWLVTASLVITAAEFTFFLVAPAIGFPLTFDQAIRLLEIVFPVFLGYLGSATHFVFRSQRRAIAFQGASSLFGLVVRGPIFIFGVAVAVALWAFGYSNRLAAVPGSGMSVDALAIVLSIALGLTTVSTNVVVAYIFQTGDERHASGR